MTFVASILLAFITFAQNAGEGFSNNGLDLTPIIVAAVAGLGGAGGAALLTVRRTNQKIEAESEEIYQKALSLAEDRSAKNFETMRSIANTLEARLEATDKALEVARLKVEEQDRRIEELHNQSLRSRIREDAALHQLDITIEIAKKEREQLQARIVELEERVTDLLGVLPGRRRKDPKPKSVDGE